MTKQTITKESNILEVINKYPEANEVFHKHGFSCVGCAMAQFENIEQGAQAHGIDIEKLVDDLNKAIDSKK